jgi:hypothetical protein
MAQSRRDESQRPPGPEPERAVDDDRAAIAAIDEDEWLFDSVAAIPEYLDLGHARLRNECWAPVRCGAQRSVRPARKRSRLHFVRPSAAAEARLIPEDGEFLD